MIDSAAISATLDAMLGAGCSADQIVVTVKALLQSVTERDSVTGDDALERKRAHARERQRNRRERLSVTVMRDVTPVTLAPSSPPPSPAKETSPPAPPLKKTNPSPRPTLPPAEFASAFARFWDAFPNKVGKAAAVTAMTRALTRVDLETMLAGLDRYLVKSDDRPWCNPATWLNQDRWTDEPALILRQPNGTRNRNTGQGFDPRGDSRSARRMRAFLGDAAPIGEAGDGPVIDGRATVETAD